MHCEGLGDGTGRGEKFRSRELAYPQSYQSSKEIKSLSKYNYDHNHIQNIHKHHKPEIECEYEN